MTNNAGPPRATADQRIGVNVRAGRRIRKWTLADLAERVEKAGGYLTVAQLSKIELGKRGVGADDLEVLAAALYASTDELLVPIDEERLAAMIKLLDRADYESSAVNELTYQINSATWKLAEMAERLTRTRAEAAEILREYPDVYSSLMVDEQKAVDDLVGAAATKGRKRRP